MIRLSRYEELTVSSFLFRRGWDATPHCSCFSPSGFALQEVLPLGIRLFLKYQDFGFLKFPISCVCKKDYTEEDTFFKYFAAKFKKEEVSRLEKKNTMSLNDLSLLFAGHKLAHRDQAFPRNIHEYSEARLLYNTALRSEYELREHLKDTELRATQFTLQAVCIEPFTLIDKLSRTEFIFIQHSLIMESAREVVRKNPHMNDFYWRRFNRIIRIFGSLHE